MMAEPRVFPASHTHLYPTSRGHVGVVVSSATLHKGTYPFAYWGKLDSVGEKNAPVTQAYNAKSVDKVVYAAKAV